MAAVSEYYIARNTRTDEYLAEKKLLGRFYMTPDITNVDYKSMLVIETIKVY